MNGYGSHTFKWVNAAGEEFLVKYHFKTDQGIKNFTAEEAAEQGKQHKDWATHDLHEEIRKGNFPSWTWFAQIMPIKDADNYRFDVYDVTKVWPHSDYPLVKIGKLTLNRNPDNFHAETEQSAFAPAHMVPGIEPSNDKMLQGRLVNYPDTHRHRLGPNYDQIPINCPYRARMGSYNIRDGFMTVHGGNAQFPTNYEPSSVAGTPRENKAYANAGQAFTGDMGRYAYTHPNTVYEQPRALFRKVFDDDMRKKVIANIAGGLGQCRRDIQERMLPHFYKVDPEYGEGIAKAIGIPVQRARL
jgi:catalase